MLLVNYWVVGGRGGDPWFPGCSHSQLQPCAHAQMLCGPALQEHLRYNMEQVLPLQSLKNRQLVAALCPGDCTVQVRFPAT